LSHVIGYSIQFAILSCHLVGYFVKEKTEERQKAKKRKTAA